jgi:hypothetical protein
LKSWNPFQTRLRKVIQHESLEWVNDKDPRSSLGDENGRCPS